MIDPLVVEDRVPPAAIPLHPANEPILENNAGLTPVM